MVPEGTVLGFDFGQVRIGLALGNTLTGTARAYAVIDARSKRRWEAVAAAVAEWQPAALVVGVPRHPDGTAHEVTQMALRFARQLAGRFRLPVYTVDERYSSVQAQSFDPDADVIDDAAAAVILQQWFDEGCPQRTPEGLE